MWILEKKKTGSGQQELQVIIKIKEMVSANTSAEAFVSTFKDELSKVRKTNIFSAIYGYRADIINEKNIEIWKMKANGDRNYLMFKLLKGEDIPGPFDHL